MAPDVGSLGKRTLVFLSGLDGRLVIVSNSVSLMKYNYVYEDHRVFQLEQTTRIKASKGAI